MQAELEAGDATELITMATYHGDLLMANYFAGGARGGRSDRAAAARARGTTYYGYVWLFMATYNGYTCCG